MIGRLVARACSTASSTSVQSIFHPTVYMSGLQATGIPHLGNYYGLIKPWCSLQNDLHSSEVSFFLCIADMHSLSLGPQPPQEIRSNIYHMAACLIACGVDPKKTILFRQSAIPEIPQLSWMLSSLQTVSKLQRLPQYKDKSQEYARSGVPLGLLSYPVLQAADVMALKATHVPIGKDQSQHMNLLTDLALSWNTAYNTQLFPVPQAVFPHHARVKSLRNPQKKMSKSERGERGRIHVIDSEEQIIDKCKKAQSDSISEITYDTGRRTAVANLIDLLAAVRETTAEEVMKEASQWDTITLKDTLASDIETVVRPIRQRYQEIVEEKGEVERILREGEEKAREVVVKTVQEALVIAGFR